MTPLAGAAISDSYLGKYKTILWMTSIYIVGLFILSLVSVPGVLGSPPNIPSWGPLIGLGLMALGTGGIKPCVASLGGDQFSKAQTAGLNKYYNYYYIVINVGSCLAAAVAPFIKKQNCFGNEHDCFPGTFFMCSGVLLFALIILILGRKFYKNIPPVTASF